jgi:EAL domain-containing protein (putative c-di-GMP-specific phosphodiesterase class I)
VQTSDRIGIFRKEQLTLFYQPQMSADGTRIACVEGLLRLNHQTRGLLGPGNVLPYLDNSELMDQLDWWVIERACVDALRWPSITVSANVSATQFLNPDFARRVLAVIAEVGVPPEQIELEIVETAFIDDFETACRNISLLRDKGVRIALDDFGTGYSSLTYLLRMPIDKLKIDKCFIDKVDFVQSAAIVHALIAMARSMGLKVTAEGVETESQLRILRAAGCHYIQGFLFSGAVSTDGISRLLENQKQSDFKLVHAGRIAG